MEIKGTITADNIHYLTLGGNSTSAGAGFVQLSSGTITLAGGNNVTLSQNGNAVTISGPNTVAQTVESQSLGMSNIGNTSGTTGIASGGQARFLFAGGNNITLSQSLNGASGTITISGPATAAQTNQSVGLYGLGNTTQNSSTTLDARSISYNGLGIITVGYSNGSVQLSATTAAQTVESNTLGISNLGNTAGTSGVVSGGQVRFVFAGGNNITLSQSLNGASGTITISAPNLGGGAGFTAGMSTQGNTSGDTGPLSSQLILIGGNNITLSQSTNGGSGSLTISAANQTVQSQNFAANNFSGGNSLGNTFLATSGTVAMYGGSNITLSLDSANQKVSISGPTPGTISMWPDVLPGSTAVSTYYSGSTSQGAGGASSQTGYTFSIYVVPMPLPSALAFSNLRIGISNTRSGAGTGSVTQMYSVGIYTNNANTLSLVEDFYGGLFFSQNSVTANTFSVFTASTGGNTIGGGGGFAGIAASTVYSSQGNISANSQIDNGMKFIRVDSGAATTLTAGQYFLALAMCSVSSSSNILSNVGILQSNAVSSINIPDLGRENSTQTSGYLPGWGAISTTFTSVSNAATFFPLPNAIPLANMSSSSSAWHRFHLPLMRNL